MSRLLITVEGQILADRRGHDESLLREYAENVYSAWEKEFMARDPGHDDTLSPYEMTLFRPDGTHEILRIGSI